MPPPDMGTLAKRNSCPSTYSADCICGVHFETGLLAWICPTCHRHIVIEWRSNSGDLIQARNERGEHEPEMNA